MPTSAQPGAALTLPAGHKPAFCCMQLATLPAETRRNIVRDVLARYEAGEQIKAFAHEYNTSNVTLYKYINLEAQEEWRELQVGRALARKEDAERALEEASDALSLARARELLKAAQWDLERVCRRIYGQDAPPLQITVQIGAVDARIEALERELGLIAAAQSGRTVNPDDVDDAQVIDDADLVQDSGA